MKFTCEKYQLSDAVNLAARAVSPKSNIEALEGILIEAYGERVTVTGYDLESGISSVIEATVIQPGRIVLSSHTIMDIVRKLPEDSLVFETNDKMLTTIVCGPSESTLIGINPSEYPDLPDVDFYAKLTLNYDSFRNIIRRTVFAAAVIDNRPILTGVLIESENEDIQGVAIDGYRMGIAKEKLISGMDRKIKFVVPGKYMNEMGKIILPTDEKIVLNVSEKHLQMRKGNVTYICRLLEGEFINYSTVIPKEAKTVIKVNTADIIDSVERASVIINEKLRTPVYMRFGENEIRIDCTSSLGKVHDKLFADIEGEPVEIGVNNRYMLDALRSCDTDEINIEILSNISPVVIKPREGEDFLFIVVPMRI